jgi:integrase/recombinase XerD
MSEDTLYLYKKELQNLGYCQGVIINYPKYAQNLLDYTKENPENINPNHIENYHNYLKQKVHQRRKVIISENYIHSQLLGVRFFFEYLERIGKIKINPYQLKIKSPIKTTRDIISQDQIKQLYKNCKTLEETIILHLCYGCGLRRSEAQNLDIKDINFEQKLVFIRKGKGKKRRVIPITQTISEDLKKYYQSNENYRSEKQESFMINAKGNRISGGSIYQSFKVLLKTIEKGELTTIICLHSLRHSIATHLLENEMSIEMVRNFLGHQNLNTTQIYTRTSQIKLK